MSAPAGWQNIGPWRGPQGYQGFTGPEGSPGEPGLRLVARGQAPAADLPAGTATVLSLPGTAGGGPLLAVAYAWGSKITAAGTVYLTVTAAGDSYRGATSQPYEPGAPVAVNLTVPLTAGAGPAQFGLQLTSQTNHWRVTAARLFVYEIREA